MIVSEAATLAAPSARRRSSVASGKQADVVVEAAASTAEAQAQTQAPWSDRKSQVEAERKAARVDQLKAWKSSRSEAKLPRDKLKQRHSVAVSLKQPTPALKRSASSHTGRVPNFAAMHRREFEKKESVDSFSKRRAELLLRRKSAPAVSHTVSFDASANAAAGHALHTPLHKRRRNSNNPATPYRNAANAADESAAGESGPEPVRTVPAAPAPVAAQPKTLKTLPAKSAGSASAPGPAKPAAVKPAPGGFKAPLAAAPRKMATAASAPAPAPAAAASARKPPVPVFNRRETLAGSHAQPSQAEARAKYVHRTTPRPVKPSAVSAAPAASAANAVPSLHLPKPHFDLQKSLQRPLGYTPHTGALRDATNKPQTQPLAAGKPRVPVKDSDRAAQAGQAAARKATSWRQSLSGRREAKVLDVRYVSRVPFHLIPAA